MSKGLERKLEHYSYPETQREILIYGLPEGETRPYMEELLYTKAQSVEEAERVIKHIADRFNYHSMRIAFYNGEKPDFSKTVNI